VVQRLAKQSTNTASTSVGNTDATANKHVDLLPRELRRQPTSAHKRRLGEPKANLRCEGLPQPKIWPSDEEQRWRPLRWLEKTKCLVCPRMIAYRAKGPKRTGIHQPPARLTNIIIIIIIVAVLQIAVYA